MRNLHIRLADWFPLQAKHGQSPSCFLTPSLENYRVSNFCNSNTSHHPLKKIIAKIWRTHRPMDLLFISFVSDVSMKYCQRPARYALNKLPMGLIQMK